MIECNVRHHVGRCGGGDGGVMSGFGVGCSGGM